MEGERKSKTLDAFSGRTHIDHNAKASPPNSQRAHLATRCSTNPLNKITFEHYVGAWLKELNTLLTWEPLKNNRGGLQRFFIAPMCYTH